MNFFSGVSYYFQYFNFNRGDRNIREYFEANTYNKAIKELTEEGYGETYIKFKELFEAYSLYTPINKEENKFIENIKDRCIFKKKNDVIIEEIDRTLSLIKYHIVSYKKYTSQFDIEYKLTMIKKKTKILKNIIKQLKPFAEAVILRRFVKKLLEIYIFHHIEKIDLENFIPNQKALENYKESLGNNYIYRQGQNKDIKSSIETLIQIAKLKSTKEKNTKALNPKIVYKNKDSNVPKVIKLLLKAKKQCNQLIHFNNEFQENIIINEYIINGSQLSEEGNENSISDEISELSDSGDKIKEKYIHISKIAKFIAYENDSTDSMVKLSNLRKEVKQKIKKIKEDIELIEEDIDLSTQSNKESVQTIKEMIDELLLNLSLKNYSLNLNRNQINKLNACFKENPLEINDINIPVNIARYEGMEDHLNYFNQLRNQMSIKERIKFNITFSNNIRLLNAKYIADDLNSKLDKIEAINIEILDLQNYFNTQLQAITSLIKQSGKIIQFFDRDELFKEIKKEEFMDILNDDLGNKTINVYDLEINNYYLYIYLLKKDLYDELSYKKAAGINEDYI